MKNCFRSVLICLLALCLMLLPSLSAIHAETKTQALLREVLQLSTEERAAFIEDLRSALELIGESGLMDEAPSAGISSSRMEGAGFETAQAALAAWLSAIREGDVRGAVSCYAIESLIDHLSPETLSGLRDLSPMTVAGNSIFIPVPDPLYYEVNLYSRVNVCCQAVVQAMTKLIDPEASDLLTGLISLYQRMFPEDKMDILIKEIPTDDAALAELDHFTFLEEMPDLDLQLVQKEAALIARCFGAEDVQPVRFSFSSSQGDGTVTTYAIRYSGRWYLFWTSRELVGTTIGTVGCTGLRLDQ